MCGDARIAHTRACTGWYALLAMALAAIGSLIAPLPSLAATWQGPTVVSPPGATAFGPTVAIDAAGHAGLLAWDSLEGGRLTLARRSPVDGWTAPVTLVAPVPVGTRGFVDLDGSGTITAIYAFGGTAVVATWPAGAPAPHTVAIASGVGALGGLAVSPSGAAVLVGTDDQSPSNVLVGYRSSAEGDFDLRTYPGDTGSAAIGATGVAVVTFRANGVSAVVRTAASGWPALPEIVGGSTTPTRGPIAGIDAAGNPSTAFVDSAGVVWTAGREFAGGPWSTDAVTPAGSMVGGLSYSLAQTGAAVLAWYQVLGIQTNLRILTGRADAGLFHPTAELTFPSAIAAPLPFEVVALAGADGGAAVMWQQQVGNGFVVQARTRSAGAWGPIQTFTTAHGDEDALPLPALTTDDQGTFAASGAVNVPPVIQRVALLWISDGAAPALSAPTVAGDAIARTPLTFSAQASDAWSAVGAPEWSFGDGASGSGPRVTHAYDEPGTYHASVSVTDAGGNTAAREVTVVVRKAVATLSSARFAVRWKRSRAEGTLAVAGRVPLAGTYAVELRRGSAKLVRTLQLAPGSFGRAVKLPSRLIPGTYRVRLVPQALPVTVEGRTAKLGAPSEGVVDAAFLSGSRTGKAARRLTGSRNVWATFHFTARAAGKLRLTWYLTSAGRRTQVRGVTRAPSARVRDAFAPHGRKGTVTAVLRRAGRIVAEVSVQLR